MLRSCRAALALLLLASGCPSETPTATGPKADTVCPKELPANCKVLKDENDTNKRTYAAEPQTGKVTIKVPFTEGATEEWAQSPSFLQVMNNFTDVVTSIFENCVDAKHVTFIALWKDQEMAHIDVGRSDYQ